MEKQRPREVRPFPRVTQLVREWGRELPVTAFLGCVSSLPHGAPLVALCPTQWRDTLGRPREPHVAPPNLLEPLPSVLSLTVSISLFPVRMLLGISR